MWPRYPCKTFLDLNLSLNSLVTDYTPLQSTYIFAQSFKFRDYFFKLVSHSTHPSPSPSPSQIQNPNHSDQDSRLQQPTRPEHPSPKPLISGHQTPLKAKKLPTMRKPNKKTPKPDLAIWIKMMKLMMRLKEVKEVTKVPETKTGSESDSKKAWS